MRIGIISLIHESNTFLSVPTTYDMFAENMYTGDDLLAHFKETFDDISGVSNVLEQGGQESAPIY